MGAGWGGQGLSSVTARMAELGIVLPPVPTALAAYVPALVVENLCFTSGQLPMVAGTLACSGIVGLEVDVASAKEAAKIAALNALSAAAEASGGIQAIAGVVKVTGFVQSHLGFHQEPQVINGASELFEALFGTAGRHARSAVGVLSLPLNAAVEIECVFRLGGDAHG